MKKARLQLVLFGLLVLFGFLCSPAGSLAAGVPGQVAVFGDGTVRTLEPLSHTYQNAATFTITVNIGAPSQPLTGSGPVSYTVTYTGADTITLGAAHVILNPTGTAAAANVAVNVSGPTTRTVTLSGITGDGSLGISIDAGTATNAGGGSAPAAGPSELFVVDNTPPGIMISPPSLPATRNTVVTYTVTYSDPNFNTSTLSASNVTLFKTGSADGSLSFDAGSGSVRTVTISSITGTGNLGISIAGGTATDLAGNPAPSATSATFIVDNTPPSVAISSPSATVTKAGPVTYTVTYTDSNFNSSSLVPLGNLTLNTTSTATGTLSVDPGNGSVRTVTISNITGDGTLGISIATGSATDIAGNTAGAAGPSATFTVDNTPPTVSIGSPSFSMVKSGQVSYSVTYSDPNFDTSSLAGGNITLNKTGTANGTVSVDPGAGSVRTVTISGITGSGSLWIGVGPGTATDLAGNLADGAGPSASVAVNPCPRYLIPRADVEAGFSTFSAAYNAAVGGDEIRVQAGIVNETPLFDQNILVWLKGGYDCSYGPAAGRSTFAFNGTAEIRFGTVIFDRIVLAAPDVTPPALSQVTPVPNPTNNPNPTYEFSSTEPGTIGYGGPCTSATTLAIAGTNTLTVGASPLGGPLPDGPYNGCTVTVTDESGNTSLPLPLNAFLVDTVAPTDGTLNAVAGDKKVLFTGSTDATDNPGGSGLALTNTYKLVRATGLTAPADCGGIAVYQGSALPVEDTGLTNGVTYSYRLCAYDQSGNVSLGATSLPVQLLVKVTVTKTGLGTGDVTANGSALAWNGNVGTAFYTLGTSVTLTAAPFSCSYFGGWDSVCFGNGLQCMIPDTTVDSATNASFLLNKMFRNMTSGAQDSALTVLIGSASNGVEIRGQAGNSLGAVTMTRPGISLLFRGGFDCDFLSNALGGRTSIGGLTIEAGTLTVEALDLK